MSICPPAQRPKILLIACGMFGEEINNLLARRPPGALEVELVWLDAALHMYLDRLTERLTAAIDEARAAGYQDIKLVIGHGCLPDMADIARERKVELLPAKNCLAAFLSEAEIQELEQNRTMVMTSAWVRLWPQAIHSSVGWDPVDFRIMMGRYDRLLVFETGAPLTDEEVLEFFDLVQVPLEVRPLGPDNFEKLLNNLIAPLSEPQNT